MSLLGTAVTGGGPTDKMRRLKMVGLRLDQEALLEKDGWRLKKIEFWWEA